MRVTALLGRSAAQARVILLGATAVFFVFQYFLIAHAAEIERSQAFGHVADLLPAFLQRGLGAQALALATFKGSVAFGYFHPVIVCAVSLVAIYLATEPAHDVESGLVDLVLARAVPRHRLLTRSLILAMCTSVGFIVVMMTGTYVGLRTLAPQFAWPSFALLALLAVHLVAVAWCCAAIGLLAAAFTRRWTTAFTIGAAVVIVGYLVDFLAIGWAPARVLAWAFPFNYYPALLIVGGTARPSIDLSILAGVTIAFTALAYWRFERRDL